MYIFLLILTLAGSIRGVDCMCDVTDVDHVDGCIQEFVFDHQQFYNTLRASNSCRTDLLTCRSYTKAVNCVNKLTLAHGCRKVVEADINAKIAELEIECTVQNLVDYCPSSPRFNAGTGRTRLSAVCVLITLWGMGGAVW